MPIDGSPKNGDYARYIEEIINRKGGAPAALAQMGATTGGEPAALTNDDAWSRHTSPTGWSSQPAKPADPLGGPVPWGRSSTSNTVSSFPPPSPSPVPPASDTNLFNQDGPTATGTLATQGTATLAGVIRILAGIVVSFILFVWVVSAVFAGDPMQASTIVPAIIMFIVARGLIRAGMRRLREARNTAPDAVLPPLNVRRDRTPSGRNTQDEQVLP